MKTGIFGGTFDPVHLGHLRAAEEAENTLGLSEVLLVPAGQPMLKPSPPVTSAEHRLQMLRLAIVNKPSFRVSEIEIKRPGPSYTVDTLEELLRQYDNDEVYFILGWGSLSQLPQWRNAARIIELCRLVAVPRPGYDRPDIETLEAEIPGISKRVIFLDAPHNDISASAVRERIARGLSIEDLVTAPVADYIKKHQLYTT